MGFQLIEAAVVGPVLGKVLGAAEGVEVGEHGVALNLSGILYTDVVGVGIHAHYTLAHLLG